MKDKFKFYDEKLYEIRKSKGLSQEELAEKVGVSRQTIHCWESGKSLPDTENIIKLCQVLDISISDISDGIKVNKMPSKQLLHKIIKILLLLILIIVIIYIIISIKKFVIICLYNNKTASLNEIDNYYIKYTSYEQDGLNINNEFEIELFVKGNKYKLITSSSTIYGDTETQEEYVFYDNEDTFEIHTGEETSVAITGIASYLNITFNNDITDFVFSFNPFFKAYINNGNYCFETHLKNGDYTATVLNTINKETGFPVQTVVSGNDGIDKYTLYTITTDTVTDADFEMPDINE